MQNTVSAPAATAPLVAADAANHFPPFSLQRLLETVFAPRPSERVAILIDLPDPRDMRDYGFLADPKLTIQRIAHDTFYQGLQDGVLAEMDLSGGDMFAYQITGGSNLDLPDLAVDAAGRELSLEKRHLPELRPDPLHLDLLGHRAADGLRQAVRLPRRDAARRQPDHPRIAASRSITTKSAGRRKNCASA